MRRKEHLTLEGLRQIIAIKAAMNLGLSEKLQLAFPDVVPVERCKVEPSQTIDPNWLAGFTSAEGCFFIVITSNKTHSIGFQVLLVFIVTQHSRDENLIRRIRAYLNCGQVYKNRDAFDYRVTKFIDITDKIIPLFKKYPIRGVKALDCRDWCKAAELIKNKKHLTAEGLDEIRHIKEGMNTLRKF